MIDRLLSWLEYKGWIEKVAVRICLWCDCCLLPNVDEEPPRGPIMTPANWPPELARHDEP